MNRNLVRIRSLTPFPPFPMTAILHNKTTGKSTRDYIISHGSLGASGRYGDVVGGLISTPGAALNYIRDAVGLKSTARIQGTFDAAKGAGHYVVVSRTHIMYGQVLPNGSRYLYDPQIHRIVSWDEAVILLDDLAPQGKGGKGGQCA